MNIPKRKQGKYAGGKFDPLMTEEKFKWLSQKFARLKSERPNLAAEVRRLSELGDFSENVEYQLAKGKLRGVNNTILILENLLNQAEIIESPDQNMRVEIGHTVTLESKNGRKKYTILGSSESNPERGIISHNSPIGAALIGRRVGEKITVLGANKKEIEYTIVEIQ